MECGTDRGDDTDLAQLAHAFFQVFVGFPHTVDYVGGDMTLPEVPDRMTQTSQDVLPVEVGAHFSEYLRGGRLYVQLYLVGPRILERFDLGFARLWIG